MTTETVAEEWRSVKGWPYEVSDLGRVRRLKNSRFGVYLSPTKTRYPMVNFSREIGPVYVHRLVADAFLGPRPRGKEIDHRDGNPKNNKPENLEYVTHSENISRAERNGLINHAKGERVKTSKLVSLEVQNIRDLKREGNSISYISNKYNVGWKQVYNIVNYKAWRHLP